MSVAVYNSSGFLFRSYNKKARHDKPVESSKANRLSRSVVCTCRRPSDGLMISCSSCGHYFHARCAGVEEGDNYICSSCMQDDLVAAEMLLRLQQEIPSSPDSSGEGVGAVHEVPPTPESMTDYSDDAPSEDTKDYEYKFPDRVAPHNTKEENYHFQSSAPSSPVSSPTLDFPSRSRKRKSENQMSILLGYYKQTPDPDLNLKRKIAEETGLTVKQVSDWFYNLRVRKKGKIYPLRV